MVKLVDEMLKNILLLQISLNLPSVVEAIDVGMKMLAVPLLGRFFAIIVSKFLPPSIDRLKFTKGQLIGECSVLAVFHKIADVVPCLY